MSGFYLSGIVSGFQQRKQELEDKRLEEQRSNNAREGKIYEALLQSSDPEIQSMALTGLLDTANPKRKTGLSGWMGELQKNPALEGIKRLIQTPVTTTKKVQTEPPSTQGYMPSASPTSAGTPGSLAQSTNTPTQGGAPPTPVQPLPSRSPLPMNEQAPAFTAETGVVGQAPGAPDAPPAGQGPQDLGSQLQQDPRLGSAPPGMGSVTEQQPRVVFQSPEVQALTQARGQAQGAMEGEIAAALAAGASPAEAKALALQKLRRASGLGSPFQAVAGETLDTDTGKWRPTYGTFNKQTGSWQDAQGQPLSTFRRTATTGATGRSDTARLSEAGAQYLFGRSMGELALEEPDKLIHVADWVKDYKVKEAGEVTGARADANNTAVMDKPADFTVSQRAGVAVGTTPSQVAGQIVPTAESMKTEMELKNARQQLNEILPLLEVLPSQHELIGGVLPGAVLAKRRVTNREAVAALESAVQNIAAPMQRAKGDTRLSNADLDRALDQIVQIKAGLTNPLGGDTKESALARIRQTMAFLDLADKNRIQRVQPGAPPPGGAGAKGKGKPGAAGSATQPGQEWQMIGGKLYHNGQPF